MLPSEIASEVGEDFTGQGKLKRDYKTTGRKADILKH